MYNLLKNPPAALAAGPFVPFDNFFPRVFHRLSTSYPQVIHRFCGPIFFCVTPMRRMHLPSPFPSQITPKLVKMSTALLLLALNLDLVVSLKRSRTFREPAPCGCNRMARKTPSGD